MSIRGTRSRLLSLALLFAAVAAHPQNTGNTTAATHGFSGRLVLVLPFENRSGDADLDWVGEAFPVIMDQRMAASGYLPLTRDDRMYALDHLGLPESFKPTHATTLRIAQLLDADYVVFGSFNSIGGRFNAQAQVLDVKALRMLPTVEDSTPTQRLIDLENAIAWKIAVQLDPHFNVAEETFVAASAGLYLHAFELYVRGVTATQDAERIDDLTSAVQLTPNFAPAVLALGKAYFATEKYTEAADTLAGVSQSEPQALEASFYEGLADLYIGHYPQAEQAFAFVTSRLPLPEAVNNQGVAESRAGKNAAPFYTRAISSDPSNEDYVYNLAVSERRNGDLKDALSNVDEALQMRANDADATALKNALQAVPQMTSADKSTTTPDPFQPLERIERTWQEASFREAAFEMEQMRIMRLASLPAAEQSAQRVRQGDEYLAEGLSLEAEHEFQAALAANATGPSAAAAHAGMAEVRAQNGSVEEARSEATASLRIQQNATALVVLARLDLAANQLDACAAEVRQALRIEPNNAAAIGMQQALALRGKTLQ
jgi:tetratricopeptide (TPR) repeat protein